tara:strand:+ start:44446 stop:45726 length:1281 start_codon:yes stop_codon:yes gene_type:complete
MKVLIIGSGGREHALGWKIAQSRKVSKIYIAPGNGGTELEPALTNVNIEANNIRQLLEFAIENKIDLTIVGPEDPLVNGITDIFQENGLKCFGPSKAASQLEGSKGFMKDFLNRHDIPTAKYEVFHSFFEAKKYIETLKPPIVIKADGLAAGKGVTVALTLEEAIKAADDALNKKIFGDSGNRIVVEEFLEGEEASFIVLTDGEKVIPFASSQDHKCRDENDKGPNTGGMGAYSPAPIVSEKIYSKVIEDVIYPTINGLKKEGIKYCGFLYAGLMISPSEEIKVLEYNCRFGDPETQPIMMRLETDLAELCLKACSGELIEKHLEWKEEVALGVVMASEGYPGNYDKGKSITGIGIERNDFKVFHAGTTLENGKLKTSGGRVLCVTVLGEDIVSAQKKVYQETGKIAWEGSFYRKDIGQKAIYRKP